MSKYSIMPFPKREWRNIEKQLKEGHCSSVRCCQQLGKYKAGDIFSTPWGDQILIKKVTRYSKAEDIPTWHLMDKIMRTSVKQGEQFGDNKWDYVIFQKTEN